MSNSDKEKCRDFQACSAALCPLDPHPRHLWHADTEVCRRASVPDWVRIQRKIVRVNPTRRHYYTIKMLESVKRVTPRISGIDYPGYHPRLESEWIALRGNGQSGNKVR